MADDKKENAISRYFRETAGELRKVNWPTWPEALQLTVIVLAVMTSMGLILWFVDSIGATLLDLALGVKLK